MAQKIEIQNANTSSLMKSIFRVRREVFVVEQGVSEKEEYDEYETSSTHLAASIDGEIVGTCRYRNTSKGVKLERFAILKAYREYGVGKKLLMKCLEANRKSSYIYLHAQIQVVDFYTKFGFVKEGAKFEEAGIEHFKMVHHPS